MSRASEEGNSIDQRRSAYRWGVAGFVAFVVSWIGLNICQLANAYRVHDLCGIRAVLLEAVAVGCGILAAVRGNKWWLIMSGLAAWLFVTTTMALIVGDL